MSAPVSFVRATTGLAPFHAPHTLSGLPRTIALRTLGAVTLFPLAGLAGGVWHGGRSISWIMASAFTFDAKTRSGRIDEAREHIQAARQDLQNGAKFIGYTVAALGALAVSIAALPVIIATGAIAAITPIDAPFQAVSQAALWTARGSLQLYVHMMEIFLRLHPDQPSLLSFFNGGENKYAISAKRSDLEARPDGVLKNLVQDPRFFAAEGIHVTYVDDNGERMNGIDVGGLTRDFVSGLFTGLVKQAGGDNPGRYAFTAHNGGHLPVLSEDGEVHGRQKEGYRGIGHLMGIALRNSFVTGEIFSNDLFAMFQCLTQIDLNGSWSDVSDDTRIRMLEILEGHERHYQQLFILLRADAQNMQLDEGMMWYAYPDGEFPDELLTDDDLDLAKVRENYEVVRAAVREQIMTQVGIKRELPAIFEMAKGLCQAVNESETSWAELTLFTTSDEFAERIQGKLTKEDLLQKLTVYNATVRRYFETWVNAASDEQLRNFVKAVSGSPTVGTAELKAQCSSSIEMEQLWHFHTCFNSVDLPIYAEGQYDLFKQKLEQSIEYALAEGFGAL